MIDVHRDPRVDDLERCFSRILTERMQDYEQLNPHLHVQAVCCEEWGGRLIGILITPWFMGMVLFEMPHEDWSNLDVGSVIAQGFPSGSYDFTAIREEEIGTVLVCSLFAPVDEFDTQEEIIDSAKATMEVFLADRISEREQPQAVIEKPLPKREEKVSRRGFLRGSFFRRS